MQFFIIGDWSVTNPFLFKSHSPYICSFLPHILILIKPCWAMKPVSSNWDWVMTFFQKNQQIQKSQPQGRNHHWQAPCTIFKQNITSSESCCIVLISVYKVSTENIIRVMKIFKLQRIYILD